MKKALSAGIVLLSLGVLVLSLIIVKREHDAGVLKEKGNGDDDSYVDVDPMFKKYLKTKWKDEAEKIRKEMKK